MIYNIYNIYIIKGIEFKKESKENKRAVNLCAYYNKETAEYNLCKRLEAHKGTGHRVQGSRVEDIKGNIVEYKIEKIKFIKK